MPSAREKPTTVVAGTVIERENKDRIAFLQTSRETDGELLEVEVTFAPTTKPPPMHFHPSQDEFFEVLEGEMLVLIEGDKRSYRAGESFSVPAGSRHAMHNASASFARLRWQTRPALTTERLFLEMWSLPEQRDIFHLADILAAHPQEFRLARPNFFVQRSLFLALRGIGRLLGRLKPPG